MSIRLFSGARRRLLCVATALLLGFAVGFGAPAATAQVIVSDSGVSVLAQLPPAGIDGWFQDPDSVHELPPLPATGAVDMPTDAVSDDPPPSDGVVATLLPWIPGFAIALAIGLLLAGAVGLFLATRRPVRSD